MSPSPLTALSPLDGRYHGKVDALRGVFSEFGLIKRRVQVEVAWLIALSECDGISEVPPLSEQATAHLYDVIDSFSEEQASQIKAI